jgi:hypothetical protein
MDTVFLALNDFKTANHYHWRNSRIDKIIYQPRDLVYSAGPLDFTGHPNGNCVEHNSRAYNALQELLRKKVAKKLLEVPNEIGGKLVLRQNRLLGCQHWLSVRVFNVSLLERLSTHGTGTLDEKMESRTIQIGGDLFELTYRVCRSNHEPSNDARTSLMVRLAPF